MTSFVLSISIYKIEHYKKVLRVGVGGRTSRFVFRGVADVSPAAIN